MKKTVASLALLVSAAPSFALIAPGGRPQPQPKNVCLSVYQGEEGESYLGDCDMTPTNVRTHATLYKNGCAQNQASLKSFRVHIPACVPIAQL